MSTTSDTVTTRSAPDWADLADSLDGELGLPGDPVHAGSAPWNVAVVQRPAAVVRPADVGDVSRAVRWAAAHGLRLCVQCTGHSAYPAGDDVVLLDSRSLTALRVDPAARTATFGAGLPWAAVVAAAGEHGLAPVTGSSPTVGAVGFLTGGGFGPLSRSLGLGSDRVRSWQLVTADGQVRDVTPETEPDLAWALAGGKSTAGIVTAVTVGLVALARIYGGSAVFGADDIETVLRAWPAWAQALPPQATTSVAVQRLPDLPTVPPPLAGTVTLAVRFGWTGPVADGPALVAPLLALATPVLGGFDVLPATDVGTIHADPPDPAPAHEESQLLTGFDDAAVTALLGVAGPGVDTPVVMVEVRQLGGAMTDGPDVAYDGRGAPFHLALVAAAVPDLDAPVPALDAILGAMQPWSAGLGTPNFLPRADPARYYSPQALSRLREIGNRYDPGHVLDAGQVAR